MGLIGENGAGKSTTMRLILGMIKKDAGSIRVLGQDVDAPGFSRVREDIGVVLDEVGMPQGLNAVQIGRVLRDIYRQWDAAAYANYLDMLTIPKKQAFCKLSRGTKMKLGIAAALSHRPKLLLLDEATSSIDTRTEALVQGGMDKLMKGRTVFVIAHRLSTVQNSDVIMVLDHGRIIERGNHEKLIAEKGTYYRLYTGAFELE